MAYNQSNTNNNAQAAQNPFWDWVRSLDNAGAGVDHPAQGAFSFWPPPPPGHHGSHPPPPPPPPGPHGPPPHHDPHFQAQFPFGPAGFFGGRGGGFGGFGGGGPGMGHCGGRRGRRGSRHHQREGSPAHERSVSPEGENEKTGSDGEGREHSPHGRHGRRGHHGRGGGRGGRGFGRRGPPPPPFGGPGGAPFDLSALMQAFASHPIAQAFRGYADPAAQQSGETLVPDDFDSENSFTPPIDVFSTETSYVLHVALPGAKKEDVGVNWDAEKSVLNVAGVVYRLGDEEFLKGLTKAERKIGAFERTIKLPPGAEDKDEIDGDGITAKLEDGVLVITVPKVEKEWTEVKKVDII